MTEEDVADCRHYAKKIEHEGGYLIPIWCDFCLRDFARNRMHIGEALFKLQKMIPPEAMDEIMCQAEEHQRNRKNEGSKLL